MPEMCLQDQILQKLDDLVVRCDRLVGHVASIDSRLREATSTEPQRLYTRNEAADILGVTPRTIDRRIRSGDLEIVRNGTSVRVVGASIQGRGSYQQRPAAEVLRL